MEEKQRKGRLEPNFQADLVFGAGFKSPSGVLKPLLHSKNQKIYHQVL